MKEEVLVDIGLGKNEAKVYLALLKIGPSPVTKISETVKLFRSNVYEALDKLIQKGLVSHIMINNSKIYEASDPKLLLNIIKQKELKLQTIMPRLELDNELIKEKPIAKIYEGLKAFRNILENSLDYYETLHVFGTPKCASEMMKHFIMNFHRERIRRKIRMKHIYNSDAKERVRFLNSLEYTEAKHLPPEFDTPVTTQVCKEEVLIIDWREPLTFVQIKNKKLAETYKKYYRLLDKHAKTEL